MLAVNEVNAIENPCEWFNFSGEHYILEQLKMMHAQSELLQKITIDSKGPQSLTSTVGNDRNSIILDNSLSYQNIHDHIFDLEQPGPSGISLSMDCKLKRSHFNDDFLMEIQKKCSQECYLTALGLIQKSKSQEPHRRKTQIQYIQKTQNVQKLINLKNQNQTLAAEIDLLKKQIKNFQQEKIKIKQLSEKCLGKEASLLKSEKNNLNKERSINQLKKKLLSIYELVSKEVNELKYQVNLINDMEGVENEKKITEICHFEKIQFNLFEESWLKFSSEFMRQLEK